MTQEVFMSTDPEDLFKAIDERRDELVDLTRALIRFPTVNPPGEAYRPCAEFIGDRLRARGFSVDYVHAAGTPGDSAYALVNPRLRAAGGA
jgi:succinyl-diaminopimelate desuccinylase